MGTEARTLAERCRTSPTAGCCPRRTALPSRDAEGLAAIFKALGDPTRLEIVALLAAAKDGALCACDIESRFDLTQSTVSHHLRLLKGAGLVSGERRGTWVVYTLEPGTLRRVAELTRKLESNPVTPKGASNRSC